MGGTRHAIALAVKIRAGCFHHTSSIAVAGLYRGTFREDMFEEAEGLSLPYFRSKDEAEGLVLRTCRIPWRIYRPGIVVGHSKTGEIDKIDGPYYFFRRIQKMRRILPPWVTTLGQEVSRVNVVQADCVARAVRQSAEKSDLEGRC